METTKKTESKTLPFTRRHWLSLLAVAICAALYAYAQPSIFTGNTWHMPGAGLTLIGLVLLAISMLQARPAEWHVRRQSVFLLVSTVLLLFTYTLFGNDVLRLMNLPVLLGLSALALRSLVRGEDVLSAGGLVDALFQGSLGSAEYLTAPLRGLRNLDASARRLKLKGFGVGLLLCIPVVLVAGTLLSQADESFAAALTALLGDLLGESSAAFFLNFMEALLLTLMIFAFVYGLRQRKKSIAAVNLPNLLVLSLSMVLIALILLYSLFLIMVLRPSDSGPADSARTGFFQLVAVAFLTLLVVLPSLCSHPRSRILRILSAILSLLTMGLLLTAALRMFAYIRIYGLSLLRLVTLWGMAAIAAAMIAAIIKCIRPGAKVCRALAIFTIVTWLALNYANMDVCIARYNIRAWEQGQLAELDVDYLLSLSLDVLTVFEGHIDSLDETSLIAYEESLEILNRNKANWFDWSLGWTNVK